MSKADANRVEIGVNFILEIPTLIRLYSRIVNLKKIYIFLFFCPNPLPYDQVQTLNNP